MGTWQQTLKNAFIILGSGYSIFAGHAIYTGNERFYREVVMPVGGKLMDAEAAHKFAIWAAARGVSPRCVSVSSSENSTLATRVFGLNFRHPVGLAAGFDKNAEAAEGLLHDFGFSHVEVGTVTPLPQPGNEKPRVFRLPDDQAIINRYGFNSDGQEAVAERLETLRKKSPSGVVGVNVGKNKESADAAADYVSGILKLGKMADYLVVNISSPNTPGLRDLQKREHLSELLKKAIQARNSLPNDHKPPLLVKIAPDLSNEELENVCAVIRQPKCSVDGIIVGNTTISRGEELSLSSDSQLTSEVGGLSGAPLRSKSTEMIRAVYRLTEGKVPIVGVGGVSSGDDALEKMRAGASLVQLYSALAFQGPPVVEKICREMEARLLKENVGNVRAIVGSDHDGLGRGEV